MRQPVTLSIDSDLYREMKLQAVREDRDVSTITEKLYREYLLRRHAAEAIREDLKRTKAKSKK
jgi:hypothetical protein